MAIWVVLTKMSKNTIRYALVFVMLLIFTASAFALNEDFDARSQKSTVFACSGAISTDALIVQNTGDVASAYSIEASGEMAQYATFAENKFSLEPGETRVVDYFINPPQGEGSYSLKTELKTIFGLSKIITQDVKIEKCLDINLYVKDSKKESCPCDPVRYEFVLSNNGPVVESYNLSW